MSNIKDEFALECEALTKRLNKIQEIKERRLSLLEEYDSFIRDFTITKKQYDLWKEKSKSK